MTEPVKFTTVKVMVDGKPREFKMQDGIALNDEKTNKKFLFKDGKWQEIDYSKGHGLSSNPSSDTPASVRHWKDYEEYEGGFMGLFQTRKQQPEINLTEAQMECIEALMDNDGQAGLTIQDIDIARRQFKEGKLSADFSKHLSKFKVKQSPQNGVNDACIRVMLSNKDNPKNLDSFHIDYKN